MKDNKDWHQYEDIIDLPHPVSSHRIQMSIHDRAAQFSPFAALTGFEGAIKETARLTDHRIELDEADKTILDEKLRIVQENLSDFKEIELVYFRPDEMKSGGAYITVMGTVKKIDGYERVVVMKDGTRIPIDEIVDITGDMFQAVVDNFG
jgi:hypothetical protein